MSLRKNYVIVSLTEAMAIPLQRLLPRHANHCKLHTLAVKKIREGKDTDPPFFRITVERDGNVES